MSAKRTPSIQTIAMSAVCLIVLLIVGAFLFDAIRDESVAESLPTLLGFATPAMITLLTAAKLGGAVDEVKTQVNGNFDKVSNRNRELADQNRELTARIAALTGDPDSGAIPIQPPADDGGRHRRGPLDGVARFSADVTDGVHAIGGAAMHAANTRTVSGLVLPWDKIGQTTLGAITVARSGVRIPRDLARCKLHLNHSLTPNHKVVGYATAAEYRDDGLHMTFQVAATPDGDQALLEVTEHVRDAFSAELGAVRKNGNDVFDSILLGVALVDTPAFRDARVQDVHAAFHNPSQNGNTMNPKDFIIALMRAGQTEAQARAAAVTQFGQEAVDGVSADDLDFTDAGDQDAGDGAGDQAGEQGERAAASYTPGRLIVPGSTSRQGAGEAVHLSIHEAAETVRMVQHGQDVAHAALTNITASTMVDAAPPQWLGQLWEGPAKTRRLIPLLNRRDLKSRRIQAFTWTQKPLVASYAGDKAEIPTNPVSIAPYEAAAVRWAGGHDLDRAFFDFGETEILEAYWAAMHESYAIVTDQATGAWVTANAKTITDAAATDLVRAMIATAAAVDDATGVHPSYYLANPADKYTLLSVTASTVPAYMDMFGVDPRSIVWTSAVPAGQLVAGARPAATFYELAGSPLRVEAEHLSHGGRDRALFGYTAHTLDNPDGLVKVQFAAPAGG